MAEFPDFSLHVFDVSQIKMESSARFPEIDATDIIRTRTLKEAQKPVSKCLTCGVLTEAKWESLRRFPKTSLTTFFADFMQR